MSSAIEAHRKAVNADLKTMASTLIEVLGRPITAGIVGIRNPKTISRWASGEVTSVRDRWTEERLVATYQVVAVLMDEFGPDTARSFMLGMNPVLNDEAPAIVIKNGDFKGAMAAARNLIAGGY